MTREKLFAMMNKTYVPRFWSSMTVTAPFLGKALTYLKITGIGMFILVLNTTRFRTFNF